MIRLGWPQPSPHAYSQAYVHAFSGSHSSTLFPARLTLNFVTVAVPCLELYDFLFSQSSLYDWIHEWDEVFALQWLPRTTQSDADLNDHRLNSLHERNKPAVGWSKAFAWNSPPDHHLWNFKVLQFVPYPGWSDPAIPFSFGIFPILRPRQQHSESLMQLRHQPFCKGWVQLQNFWV